MLVSKNLIYSLSIILASSHLFSQALKEDSFITPKEYGKKLYENPRNIGCIKCHGKNGEGEIIAHYKAKGKNKIITAPKINNMDFKTFKKALSKDKAIMPKYDLTEDEIKAIYLYISSKK